VRAARSHPRAQEILGAMVKVKAHQEWATLPAGPLRDQFRGNHAADRAANEARELHPRASRAVAGAADALARRARLVAIHLARASARWPASGARRGFTLAHEVAGWARRRAARARRLEQANQRQQRREECLASHLWSPWRGGQRCARCWAGEGPSAGKAECVGVSPNLREVARLAAEGGHRMSAAVFGTDPAVAAGNLVWCRACGGWSVTGRSGVLRGSCGPATAAGKAAASRLEIGLFPKGDRRYHGARVTRGTVLS